MSGSKSQVSRLCKEIDGKVKTFLNWPLEGDWPYPKPTTINPKDSRFERGTTGGQVSRAMVGIAPCGGDAPPPTCPDEPGGLHQPSNALLADSDPFGPIRHLD